MSNKDLRKQMGQSIGLNRTAKLGNIALPPESDVTTYGRAAGDFADEAFIEQPERWANKVGGTIAEKSGELGLPAGVGAALGTAGYLGSDLGNLIPGGAAKKGGKAAKSGWQKLTKSGDPVEDLAMKLYNKTFDRLSGKKQNEILDAVEEGTEKSLGKNEGPMTKALGNRKKTPQGNFAPQPEHYTPAMKRRETIENKKLAQKKK